MTVQDVTVVDGTLFGFDVLGFRPRGLFVFLFTCRTELSTNFFFSLSLLFDNNDSRMMSSSSHKQYNHGIQ